MKVTAFPEMNIPDSNIYWNMLKGLSSDIKLELISKLSASLLNERASDKSDWASLFVGKWEDSRSADEIIEDIRSARTPNKEIEL